MLHWTRDIAGYSTIVDAKGANDPVIVIPRKLR